MLYDYIDDVCDILDIPVPTVSFDTSHFQTKTMMAQCVPEDSIIYLKEYTKPNPDQLFSIAHELRHIWQFHTDEQLYFSKYKPVESCSSVEEYNLQIAELDANAFAYMVMVSFFHLKPLFEGVSEPIKEKIIERVEYLKTTEFI